MKTHHTQANGAGKVFEGYTPSLQADSPALAVFGDGADTTAVPFDPKPDGPRYAAMGDAVTVNVAEWIGRRIVSAL